METPAPAPPTIPDDPLRPKFPRWSEWVQDLWVDLLQSFATALIDPVDVRESDALARVRLSALLADEAMKEIEYRFWIQHPPRKTRKTKTRAAKEREPKGRY